MRLFHRHSWVVEKNDTPKAYFDDQDRYVRPPWRGADVCGKCGKMIAWVTWGLYPSEELARLRRADAERRAGPGAGAGKEPRADPLELR